VVVGSGFVVARAAAVLVDPPGTSLDHPNAGPDVETSGVGEAFDDLHSKGENVFRPDEQPSGVTAVGPDQPDGGEAAARCGQALHSPSVGVELSAGYPPPISGRGENQRFGCG